MTTRTVLFVCCSIYVAGIILLSRAAFYDVMHAWEWRNFPSQRRWWRVLGQSIAVLLLWPVLVILMSLEWLTGGAQ